MSLGGGEGDGGNMGAGVGGLEEGRLAGVEGGGSGGCALWIFVGVVGCTLQDPDFPAV